MQQLLLSYSAHCTPPSQETKRKRLHQAPSALVTDKTGLSCIYLQVAYWLIGFDHLCCRCARQVTWRWCFNVNIYTITAPFLLWFLFVSAHLVVRLFCDVACFLRELKRRPHPSVLFFLITTVHQAGFHLERAALCCQTYNLIHQLPVRQLSVRHARQVSPTPCRSASCHSPGLSCGNIGASQCLHVCFQNNLI